MAAFSPTAGPCVLIQPPDVFRQREDECDDTFGHVPSNAQRRQRHCNVRLGRSLDVDSVETNAPTRDAGQPLYTAETFHRKTVSEDDDCVILVKDIGNRSVAVILHVVAFQAWEGIKDLGGSLPETFGGDCLPVGVDAYAEWSFHVGLRPGEKAPKSVSGRAVIVHCVRRRRAIVRLHVLRDMRSLRIARSKSA